MYNPPANRVDDLDVIQNLIERAAFGHIVSHTAEAFAATGLPLLLDRSGGSLGSLRGHFARANSHWRQLDGASVIVVIPLSDGYASPAWYPSKADDDRVVPTWNYEVVHAHGVSRIHDDPDWVLSLVSALTDVHEMSRSDDAPRWAVTDAPVDFIARQLRAIVGVEIEVTHLDGKRKLSQNRSDADRLGVIAGHDAASPPEPSTLANAMRATDGWGSEPSARVSE